MVIFIVMFNLFIFKPMKANPFHFTAKGAIYYVTVKTVLFSNGKRSHVVFICGDNVFSHESSLGISLVFI